MSKYGFLMSKYEFLMSKLFVSSLMKRIFKKVTQFVYHNRDIAYIFIAKFVLYSIINILSCFTAGLILNILISQLTGIAALSLNHAFINIAVLVCINCGLNKVGIFIENYFNKKFFQKIENLMENSDLLKRNKKIIDSIEIIKRSELRQPIIEWAATLASIIFQGYCIFIFDMADMFLIDKIINLLFSKFNVKNYTLNIRFINNRLLYGLDHLLLVTQIMKLIIRSKLYNKPAIRVAEEKLKNLRKSKEDNLSVAYQIKLNEVENKQINTITDLKKYKLTADLLNTFETVMTLGEMFVKSLVQPYKIIKDLINQLTSKPSKFSISRLHKQFIDIAGIIGNNMRDFICNDDMEILYKMATAADINSILKKYMTADGSVPKRELDLITVKKSDTDKQRIKVCSLVVKFTTENSDIPGTYKDTAIYYKDLSFSKGNIIRILGANGSGKSTLLKILAEKYHLSGSRNSTLHLPSDISFAFVSLYDFTRHYTYIANPKNFRASIDTLMEYSTDKDRTDYPQLKELLEKIEKITDTQNLSDGMKVVLMIISAITCTKESNREVYKDIIVDEALSALSDGTRSEAIRLLECYARKHNKFLFVVDHNFKDEEKVSCDSLFLDKDNKITAYYPKGTNVVEVIDSVHTTNFTYRNTRYPDNNVNNAISVHNL